MFPPYLSSASEDLRRLVTIEVDACVRDPASSVVCVSLGDDVAGDARGWERRTRFAARGTCVRFWGSRGCGARRGGEEGEKWVEKVEGKSEERVRRTRERRQSRCPATVATKERR
jgi:hypothetical protein